ncbi:MAG: hydrogenase formation protein HypD, partial [Lachnospiraceae bacterium]|nr:hydrogenase formation protein HypD [Lachnospiraceae bacterium]
MDVAECLAYLKAYDGPKVRIMEVCGSHTEAIAKSGIRQVISDRIELVSGPGCPVCVCPSGYVDRLIDLAKEEHTTVVTFGDLIRIPGKEGNLSQSKGQGASVEMVYSPLDMIKLAEANPEEDYVFGAVGFETTIPVYTLLLDQIIEKKLHNIKLLTALKIMPPAIDWLCANGAKIDAFLAPGHVSVIVGSGAFEAVSKKYKIPLGVSGFEP